jgi:polyisoprenoid-binding protein YceI
VQHILKCLLIISAVFLFLVPSVQAAEETYTLDPQHTYVLWHINHLGFSNQAGKWYASGTLTLDKAKPQNSKINATIQVANMVTGIDQLNEHLKSELFFDVAKFPIATFVSDKVTLTGKNTAKVHGILTVRGVAKPVTLDVVLNKAGPNPITNKQAAGFSATAKLKRSDFGMTTLLPALGDEVNLNIEAEAYKVN